MYEPQNSSEREPPETLDGLRRRLNRKERDILTAVWGRDVQGLQSNIAAYLYDRFRESDVRAAMEIDGRPLLRINNLGWYSITLLGALLSTKGRSLERVLIRYVAYMRRKVTGTDYRITEMVSSEVESDLKLSEQEADDLWRLTLLPSPFFGGGGGGRQCWRYGLPADIHNVPRSQRSVADYVRRVVLNWSPNSPTTMSDAARASVTGRVSPLSAIDSETADKARRVIGKSEAPAPGADSTAPGAGWVDRYKALLNEEVSTVRIFGDREPRPLEKVFVTLTILEEYKGPSGSAEFRGLMDREMRRRRDLFRGDEPTANEDEGSGVGRCTRSIKPDELLNRTDRIVITGAPGCGKTTLLKYLAFKLLPGRKLPVPLELKSITESDYDKSGGSLPKLLFDKAIASRLHFRSEGERDAACAEFLKLLAAGKAAILLDGLDEVSGAEYFGSLQGSIKAMGGSDYGRNLLIVSARPYALTMAGLDAREMEIAALSQDQIQEFLAHYYLDDPKIEGLSRELHRRRDVGDMGRTPFLLAVIAHLHRTEDLLASDCLELYEKIVGHLVGTLDREKQGVKRFLVTDPDGSLKRDLLKKVAFEKLLVDSVDSDGKPGETARLMFSRRVIRDKAKEYVQANLLAGVNFSLLASDVIATPLLREVGGDEYAFTHLTAQEYLAAEGLASLLKSKPSEGLRAFARAYFNPSLVEMEMLPMAIGLSENPDGLIRAIRGLPESLTFAGLRLRARTLAYSKPVSQETLRGLAAELRHFALSANAEEEPLAEHVVRSFSGARAEWRYKLAAELTPALKDGAISLRRRAAEALGRIGGDAAAAALIAALTDEAGDVRVRVKRALGQVGGEGTGALIAALRHEASDVRQDAAEVLGYIGGDGAAAALIAALKDEDIWVRGSAAFALGEIGGEGVGAALINAVKDEDDYVRWWAAEALGKIGGEGAAATLIATLRDEDGYLRQRAASALGKIGGEGAAAALTAALRDEDGDLRVKAASALGQTGGEGATEALVLALRDIASDVHRSAASALGHIGAEGTAALIAELRSEAIYVRVRVAEALGKIGGEGAAAALVTALRDEESDVRRSAASSLCKIGGEGAAEALIAALKDEDFWVRESAAGALGKVGGEGAAEALIAALKDEAIDVRVSAAEALGQTGGEGAAEALIAALKDEDFWVRGSAARALGKIGGEGVGAALITTFKDEDSYVRVRATEALGKIGGEGAAAALIAALKDGHCDVRRRAAAALGQTGGEGAPAALIAALKDEDSYVRVTATEALGKIGGGGVVAALTAALKDEDTHVRGRAADALSQIGGEDTAAALIATLKHEDDYDVRWHAARALSALSTSSGFAGALLAMLRNPSLFVRRKAVELAGYYIEDPSAALSELAAQDLSEEVRKAAHDAIRRIERKLAMLNNADRLPALPGSQRLRTIQAVGDAQVATDDRSVEVKAMSNPVDSSKVFVVHGRNLKARDAVFDFLGAIGLKPLEWAQAKKATGKPSPSITEILDTAFSEAGAVVVLFTPDDMAYLREELRGDKEQDYDVRPTGQARPNVLFEAGIAMGRSPERTVLVELEDVRPFTDINGIHTVKMNNSSQRRHDLSDSLGNAGCPVDITGRRWHTAGNFDAALEGL